MRKKFAIILLWLMLLLVVHGWGMRHEIYGQDEAFSWGIYQKGLQSPDLVEAGLDVKAFFEALCEGRVDLLYEMMDENLREQYRLSLDDPSYPNLLKELYGGSKMTIQRISRKEVGSFEIDAQLVTPRSGMNEFYLELGKRTSHQPHRFRSLAVRDQAGRTAR